jgi:peptidyl-prolyl cis-trans isomerase C
MRSEHLKYLLPLALALGACPLAASGEESQQDTMKESETAAPAVDLNSPVPSGDVVARVGDQDIHFSEINTMLNSSAVVGLSIPALGTPERDTVRIALLDKIVSANLIYLDALSKGVDQDPEYRRDVQRFENAILADLYYRKQLVGEVEVSEAEIQAHYNENIVEGTELSEELRTGIEAMLRKRKLEARQAELRGRLREDTEVSVYQNNFTPAGDAEREDSVVVAEAGGETITWGEVKDRLIGAGKGAVRRDPLAMEVDARLAALQSEIDTRLLAQRARAAGLESDPTYRKRVGEYRKTRLINLHRARLASEMDPSEAELAAYFEANRANISIPEFRKVQMVMVDTEEEAESIKEKIEAGELTMYRAAAEHSVAPDAKQNLGELGWIAKGKTKPQLDKVIFALQPGEIGGPVEAGGLWHLVSVQDMRDAQYTDLDEPATRKQVRRRYIHDKLDDYVVELRKNDFPVQVYEDALIRLAQQEADMVKTLAAQSKEPGSATQERVKELQKFLGP